MRKIILSSFLLWAVVGHTKEDLSFENNSNSEKVPLDVRINNKMNLGNSFEGSGTESIDTRQEDITVTGTVTGLNGAPLPNVIVKEKGTDNGTRTDFDGNFDVEVESSSSVLVSSYVGMKTIERTVGSNTTMNIVMEDDSESLDEVVVTALGIKRSEKTLTYSNQEVVGADLAKSRTTNFASNLDGKIAGLQVKTSASGAGGSTKMVLRGNKSLSGTSDPLYVIDGIPNGK